MAIVNVLSDGPPPYTCQMWGEYGNDKIPVIINDFEYNNLFGNWFGVTYTSPWYIFINDDFSFHSKTNVEDDIEVILESLLDNLGDR